ncbi:MULTISPECIES: hypothetical protein [Cryobacterium]|uniref:hypothetical protein n=1 Tax=Cryobacterium TaxID=69578 RepID=UPI000CD4431F|nr:MULTISPECIES: hypothetical protein [Cryobacterium]POH67802.1 hypothetical protein C3B60_06200 [Cryobacterium zongtaii]TFC47804.1 hypothetical protein E3O57_02400 [Cryobacterium sp. TMN-39-2]
MQEITFGGKSLLVGDAIAEALLEYAAFLASESRADTVQITAIDADGDEVTATFVLGPGTTMMAETTRTELPEPDNLAALEYITLARPNRAANSPNVPLENSALPGYDEFFGLESDEPH